MPTIVTENLDPGSDGWRKHMSSSKAAAIIGLDEWDSRYSLWMKMAGHYTEPRNGETDITRRGHYLEPALARWFADQHPDWELVRTRAWRDDQHPELISSPDYVIRRKGEKLPFAILECKSNLNGDKWGTPGTDQIPRNYLAQCLWHGRIIQLPTVYVATISSFLNFEQYVIDMTNETWANEAEWLVEEALSFLNTLPGRANEQRPDPVGDDMTYKVVKTEYEDIEKNTKWVITHEQAAELLASKTALDQAEERFGMLRTAVMLEMGSHHKAITPDGQAIASRVRHGSGSTFLRVNNSDKAFGSLRELAARSHRISREARELFHALATPEQKEDAA